MNATNNTTNIDQTKWQGRTLYAWRWVGGGYNWCRADSRKQAARKAALMGSSHLVMDAKTLVSGAAADRLVNACDKQYAGMFD